MPLHVHGNRRAVECLVRAKAAGIKRPKAIRFKQGILSPGAYIDNRKVPSYPWEWDTIVGDLKEVAVRHIPTFEVIASVATGGDMHAAALAWRLKLPLVSVRDKEKNYGPGGRIAGDTLMLPGKRVLLLEDMSTTFQSCLDAMEPLVGCGATVVATLLIDTWKLPIFEENIFGHEVHALCTGKMILDGVIELGKTDPDIRIDREHQEIMRHWLNHPEDESWADSKDWQIPA